MGIPLNIDFQQVLLHLLNFLILTLGLYYLILKAAKSVCLAAPVSVKRF